MPGSTTPIDLTSPPPTSIQDTLPTLDKTVEKRPSATDLHHSPKKQKTTTHEPPTPELTVSPAPTEGLVGIDIPVSKVTPIPTHEVPRLMVKLLSKKGRVPTRGSEFAAGYDVYSAETITIPPRNRALVSTDISIACPPGTYGRIAPRSGLAVKNFIDTGAGVIDADYRGVVKVLLFNHADAEFVVNEGDRIAQLILERIHTPEMVAVDELPESVRGAGGFGSTGGHASLV